MAEEDLIFGKMRHLFGGIEPSNMENFTVTVENGLVKINAQLPGNTIVDDQILCTVAGAVIRRKNTEYPANEFDGDLVADITTSGTITDSTANSTATYYYAAFPYSTKGVYNRCSSNQKAKGLTSNRAAINEPEPMVAFSAKSGLSVAKITAELPSSAVGAVIRRSLGGYPGSPEDGEEFMTITSSGTYTDSNVVAGLTYYYSAFPYTSSGEYSINILNRASVTIKSYKYLYGYDLDTTDSDPDTRVSYPSDVDNAGYTAAYMNYSADSFNYGSWNIAPGEKFMPRPCVLSYNGTVLYYLDPNDYTKQEDGVTSSNIASTSLSGNAMMEWPKIYTKRWEDENGVYHFRCSDMKFDEDWECWCNYDKNNNEIDHFYTAIYHAYEQSSKLRSISGVAPTSEISMNDELTYAKANGGNWTIDVVADRLLINDLLVMMGKSTDTQTVYGSAHMKAMGYTTGACNDKGLFYGFNGGSGSDHKLKVFGMEGWWGVGYNRVAGAIIDSGKIKIKLTRGTKDGSTTTDYNSEGTNYITVSGFSFSNDVAGWIDEMKTMPYGRIPIAAVNGSATTYECDQVLYSYDTFSPKPIHFGLFTSVNDTPSQALGAFAVRADIGSGVSEKVITRLSCKPSVT